MKIIGLIFWILLWILLLPLIGVLFAKYLIWVINL